MSRKEVIDKTMGEIRTFLDGISLAEMMANEKVQNVSIRQDDAQINAA